MKAKDKVGHETQGSVTQQIVTLSLSSTSGKVLSGNSITVTVNGTNYGTLSCSSANGSIATASLSGNVLTVRGTSTANGTQTTTITVRGSNGGSATYTIQCHKHYGSETSGGGCYGQSHTGTRNCGMTLNSTSRTCGNDLITKNCQGRLRYNSQGTPFESDGIWVVNVVYYCDTCGSGSIKVLHLEDSQYFEEITYPCTSTSYTCPIHSETYSSSGKCTQSVTYYTCPTHGGNYSSSGSCTSKVSYTYYTMNCGF